MVSGIIPYRLKNQLDYFVLSHVLTRIGIGYILSKDERQNKLNKLKIGAGQGKIHAVHTQYGVYTGQKTPYEL